MSKEGVDGVTGTEVADGTDECIKAVRRQIGAGADWIKVIFTVTCQNNGKALIYLLVSLMDALLYRSMQVNELCLGLDLGHLR
jgi:hypothetical protein